MSPLKLKRLSDESLGSRLASGEAAAFDELYRRYVHRLSAYGSHLLGDADSGDDVAQAALFKAYAALRAGRVPDKVKPWLFRIAHNAAIDLVARRRELPSDNLPERSAVEREPFAGALVEALATLPERQRRVYILREVHGLRIDETAAELELDAGQVEQALFAARNRLAEQLVFGDRLNCVTVQRLVAGPLDAPERRALKTHLRSCDGCRRTVGVRGRALSLLPSPLVPSTAGLEWLRGLGAGLLGGGAPAAAKIGAVFATATIAAGVPVAIERTTHQHAPRKETRPSAAPTADAPSPRSPAASAGAVEAVALTDLTMNANGQDGRAAHETSGRGAGGDGSPGDGAARDGGSSSGSDGSRGDSPGGGNGGSVSVTAGSGDGGRASTGVAEPSGTSERTGSSGEQRPSGEPTSAQPHEGETATTPAATTTPSTTETTTTSGDPGGSGGGGDSGSSGGGPGDTGGSGETTTTTTPEVTTTVALPTDPPPLPPPN